MDGRSCQRLADGMTLTLLERLANIGSEFSRAERARAAGNNERSAAAFDRCLELFDLTLADDRWAQAGARSRPGRVRSSATSSSGTTPTVRPPSRSMRTSWPSRSLSDRQRSPVPAQETWPSS